jgi:hypothetical protein
MSEIIVVTQAPNPIIQVSSPGPIGPAGAAGAAGVGVPAGGTTGQVLAKIDGTNYNTQWSSAAGYSEPTLGSTPIPSGATVTTLAGLTLTTPVINSIPASASNSAVSLWSTLTNGNGTLFFGQTSGSASISNGTGFSGTLNLANGAGTSSKTINIGASSTAGTTNINIGSNAGATSVVNINGRLNNPVVTNAQAASYTTVLADAGALIEMNNGSANNLTVPLNATVAYPTGTQINILQTGAGQTTVVATGGVTINATPGLKLRAQWSSATLIKRGTDTWVLVGDLSA